MKGQVLAASAGGSGSAHLLPHLLHLAGGVASLVALLDPQAEDGLAAGPRPGHALQPLLLALRLPQLGLGADGLGVVHVVGLHHLRSSGTLAPLR